MAFYVFLYLFLRGKTDSRFCPRVRVTRRLRAVASRESRSMAASTTRISWTASMSLKGRRTTKTRPRSQPCRSDGCLTPCTSLPSSRSISTSTMRATPRSTLSLAVQISQFCVGQLPKVVTFCRLVKYITLFLLLGLVCAFVAF